ncbi:MAG: 50S ribosomal protein L34 [Phycisphaera sp.]|nr:50S ribosomal protein L34 [Phycisphaera sp.]
MTTHYHKKRSRIKRVRKLGFRARMKTRHGRAMLNRKRREGRSLAVRKKF